MPTALIAALTAAVATIAALVLAAGPAASAAREYVARLAATDSTDSTHAPQIRRPWLLETRFQAVIALVLMVPRLWRGAHGAVADTIVALPLVAVMGGACCVDAASHRLPNRLLGWAALWLIAATGLRLGAEMLSSALGGTETSGAAGALGALWPVGRAALAALGIGIVMVVMALLPSGLGFGDVKLSALCALWLGQLSAEAPIMGIILGFFTGGLAALVLMALHRADRKTAIAFGPYLGAGAWLTWLLVV